MFSFGLLRILGFGDRLLCAIATRVFAFVGHEWRANFDFLARVTVKLLHDTIAVSGNIGSGFVGLHARQRVVFSNLLSGLHAPLNQLSFGEPLAKIRKEEFVWVVAGLACHDKRPRARANGSIT